MPDVPDPTSDRTLVMTGAGRGIGHIAAIELLRRDPRLHLAVLARSDGERLAGEIARKSGSPHVTAYAVDLASVSSIRRAVGPVVRA